MLNDLAFEATKLNRPFGVPVQFLPGKPEQPVRWYCLEGCHRVHGIEGCAQ